MNHCIARKTEITWKKKNKKRQADYIAPLQPLTLAAFPPWEGSAGAGRVRPAGRKYTKAATIIRSEMK